MPGLGPTVVIISGFALDKESQTTQWQIVQWWLICIRNMTNLTQGVVQSVTDIGGLASQRDDEKQNKKRMRTHGQLTILGLYVVSWISRGIRVVT